MSDQDPIDELSRFGAGFSTGTGGDMPRSAADVRRRGDQIRRRRTALVAGASALAVAAVAVPIFAIVGGTPKADNDDHVANDPTTPLSADNLLRDADTEFEVGRTGAFRAIDTYEGDGQATFHPCQQDKLSALGATSSFTRSFDFVVDLEPGETAPPDIPGDDLVETVAQFENDDAARSAYDTFAEWILDCGSRLSAFEWARVVPQARSVEVPTGGDAVIYDLSWGPAPEEIDPFGDTGYINETGLILQGNRIAVVAVTIIGMDYNFLEEEGGTPVHRMIPKAADRLQPDDGEPGTPQETVTSEPGTQDPAIAGDFSLAAGWPDSSEAGDGAGLIGPARDLDPLTFSACSATAPDAPHTDRLLARWENAEDYRTRQLTTYATPDQAVAAVADIRALYVGCSEGPTREDGFTPNYEVRDLALGGQSFAILGWDELDGAATTFGDTTLVVRVGSSVLVVTHAGHSGNPQGNEQQSIDTVSAESAEVIAQMCAFTEAGC